MDHNLDFCDILVIGSELDPKRECLELDKKDLQGKHIEATNSTAGYSIYGLNIFFPISLSYPNLILNMFILN